MTERRSALLWVIFLAYFTFGMITNAIGVIIPEVIKQYNLSQFAAGLLAIFFLAYGLSAGPNTNEATHGDSSKRSTEIPQLSSDE